MPAMYMMLVHSPSGSVLRRVVFICSSPNGECALISHVAIYMVARPLPKKGSALMHGTMYMMLVHSPSVGVC